MRVVFAFIFVALISVSAWGQTTYTWNQTGAASFGTAANWTPNRTSPATTDILVFDGSTTTNPVVTGIATQTIGQLVFQNGVYATFVASSADTLTISGGSGVDLQISAGATLLDSANAAITISLSTGCIGNISGTFRVRGATAATAHKLTAVDASSLSFENGSRCFIDTLSLSNLFGTAALNSVIFKSGSVLIQKSGSNPFGASQPNSVIVFQSGSKFSSQWTGTPSFSGRTYADFELNIPGGTVSVTGSNPVSVDNLTITAGTLNFNMTGTSSSIKGNISVVSGQTLNFSPVSAGTVNLSGDAPQSIGGSGTITNTANSTITISSSSTAGLSTGITINGNLTLNGTLDAGTNTITGTGGVTIASGATFITAHTGGVYGTVQTSSTSFSSTANYTFNGTSAQITSVGLPSTVNNFTINNSAGVTLSQSTTASMLYFNAGKLNTGTNTLTVSSGFSGYGSGNFVDGNLAVPVGSTGGYIFPLGQSSDYLPVTLNFTSLTGSDNVTISAIDESSTPPGGPLGSNQVLNRYFTFNKGSGITAFSADVTFSYSDADVATAGATETALKIFQWDGAQWHPLATTINTTANTADVSGLTSFSDFVLSGTSDTPLPVTMKGLTATIDAGKVRLVFTTTTEIDVVGFTISRATAKVGPFQVVSSYSSNAALKAVGSTTAGGSYEFVDAKVSAGQTYYYMIEAVGKSGMSSQVGNLMEVQVTAPKDFAVYQNYPNPFNPATTIRYDLKEQSNVRLEVYNVLGMKVRSESFQKDAGTYEAQMDLSNMPSGIYYFRMVIDGRSGSNFVSTKKMLLVK